ncbi:hypothetical protein [Pseudoxanthomonas sp. UTMC 1351]|uniref:hypothetical protein n=1 Tax=Pseudoxanthomonas sp. UTMC 1351 TaxID=2695853 RepID=UPI0034D00D0F
MTTEKSGQYSADGIKVLESMGPVRAQGFTISYDQGLDEPDQKIDACCALLRADKDLWFVRLEDMQGREMLVYRDPRP